MAKRFKEGQWVKFGKVVGWVEEVLNYSVRVQYVGNKYISNASPEHLECYEAILPEAKLDAKPVFLTMALDTWDEALFDYATGRRAEYEDVL